MVTRKYVEKKQFFVLNFTFPAFFLNKTKRIHNVREMLREEDVKTNIFLKSLPVLYSFQLLSICILFSV